MKGEMKVVLCVMNLALTALAAEPACPVCSRYHYEEMLLERVIRNELALEQTLKDIKDTDKKVVGALGKLQDHDDKVNIDIEAMERKQIVMEATLDHSIKIALTNVSESLSHIHNLSKLATNDMEGRDDSIKGVLQTPTIQFRAQLPYSMILYSIQDIAFTRVEVNEGQGYNNGNFTAPVAGLYNFAVHYCTPSNKGVYLEIVHNDKSLQKSAQYGFDGHNQCSSLQAYAVMSTGDIVLVRTTATSSFYHDDSRYWTSFSGVLIRAL